MVDGSLLVNACWLRTLLMDDGWLLLIVDGWLLVNSWMFFGKSMRWRSCEKNKPPERLRQITSCWAGKVGGLLLWVPLVGSSSVACLVDCVIGDLWLRSGWFSWFFNWIYNIVCFAVEILIQSIVCFQSLLINFANGEHMGEFNDFNQSFNYSTGCFSNWESPKITHHLNQTMADLGVPFWETPHWSQLMLFMMAEGQNHCPPSRLPSPSEATAAKHRTDRNRCQVY